MTTQTEGRRDEATERQRQRGGEGAGAPQRRRALEGRDRTGPFGMIRELADQYDRMFAGMTGGSGRGEADPWMPRVDVRRQEGAFTVRADLPGVEREDLSVEVRGDALWIAGERHECEGGEEEGYGECLYGSFLRVLPLPEGADIEQGSARFENGVLEVQIPTKQAGGRGRRIEVTGAKASEAIASAGRAAAGEVEKQREGDDGAGGVDTARAGTAKGA
jgi:HSP20 family protein